MKREENRGQEVGEIGERYGVVVMMCQGQPEIQQPFLVLKCAHLDLKASLATVLNSKALTGRHR